MTHLDEGTAPNVKNKSHSITAEVVIPHKGAEGVLLAMGGGTGGTVTLFVNGKKAGEGRVEKTIPGRYGMDTFDIGMDLNAPVVRGGIYKTPYKFTGTIDNVKIELKPAKTAKK